MRIRAVALATAVAALAACKDDPVAPVYQVIEEVEFDASLGIDLAEYTELPSGVWIRDLTEGMGATLAANDSITIDHTGWFTDGSVFSAGELISRYRGTPPRFVPGFDIGLDGLAVGGVRRILIPPELGYGDGLVHPQTGEVLIPGGLILIFEIELQMVH